MPPYRSIAIAVIAATVVGVGVLVAVRASDDEPPRAPAAGPRVVQPGAPGQSGRTLSPSELAAVTPPGHKPVDTLFVQKMIAHHAQALTMTALVKDRHQDPAVPLLAGRIEISQRDEIARMEGWLKERKEPVPGQSGHPAHTGADAMPGMLTATQLDQLGQARGAAFDRLFVTLMMQHHQGALVMVRELYATGGGVEPAADRLAREIEADQGVELRSMQDLLAKLP